MPGVRPPWRSVTLMALATVLVAASLIVAVGAGSAERAEAGTDAPAPPTTVAGPAAATEGSVLDNEFIPRDRDLSECIGAIERPGCGSRARGGWRQGLLFGVLIAGLAFIAWRIIRSARRNRPDPAGSSVQNGVGTRQ